MSASEMNWVSEPLSTKLGFQNLCQPNEDFRSLGKKADSNVKYSGRISMIGIANSDEKSF